MDENQSFLLVSSNPNYEPYSVLVSEIYEVWKFVSYISKEIPDVKLDDLNLAAAYRNLHKDICKILDRIDSKA